MKCWLSPEAFAFSVLSLVERFVWMIGTASALRARLGAVARSGALPRGGKPFGHLERSSTAPSNGG